MSFNMGDVTFTRLTYGFPSMLSEACFVEPPQSTPNEIQVKLTCLQICHCPQQHRVNGVYLVLKLSIVALALRRNRKRYE